MTKNYDEIILVSRRVLHELLFEDNKREEADPPSSANSSVHSTRCGIKDLLLRQMF